MTSLGHPYDVLMYVDAEGVKPFDVWLLSVPPRMAARLFAVIDSVAKAPPHRFSGGGAWEAMHGEMAGWYEVRQRGGRVLYRAFCLLDSTTIPERPALVVVTGMTKPNGASFSARDYAKVRAMGEHYWTTTPRPAY